uniref:TPR_REGION domain-containing protein n=1 Tax=Panagrellus redivivus TaxID=6233 RepID=A0A7E4VAE4_PANRE
MHLAAQIAELAAQERAMAAAAASDDPYSGFNDYDHAYDLDTMYEDKEFAKAVARSSHGRRPVTANRLKTTVTSVNGPTNSLMPPSAMGGRRTAAIGTGMRSAIGSRRGGEVARPMTAVRAAGYTSTGTAAGRRSTYDGLKPAAVDTKIDIARQKMLKLEQQTFALLKESMFAYEAKNLKQALEKAKEAGRKEREATKQREQYKLGEAYADMTLSTMTNLAQQYMANGMYSDALNTYQYITKEAQFNAGKFRINIGNIYFRKKDYVKALKHYRMCLDRVQPVEKRLRCKIQNNIGVTNVRLGLYEEAFANFEECMDNTEDYAVGLNLILCAYCLDDTDKMREAFQKLVDIQPLADDEAKYNQETDILTAQTLKADALRQWERARKQQAERTILTAAKVIAPRIAGSFADGYAWCVEAIRHSLYASLAVELEINKAADMLKIGEVEEATEALLAFNNKDTKVGSAAANNLALINYYKGKNHYEEAGTYADSALAIDRYNANALVNRANVFYQMGDAKTAEQYYKEALQIEASCIQAHFNLGLIAQKQGNYEKALQIFYKLQVMLKDDPQVICQLAAIYEALEDHAQAIEFYSNLNDDIDPSMSKKLGKVLDEEGDKAGAFTAYYNSHRMYPADIEIIGWMGAYYLDTQFPDKAVNYFQKAALLEPDNIKWQLLMASCQRRSGNFQKALELYKVIHRKFPTNMECLKFLVQLCRDLRMPEEKDYANKLKKIEDTQRLRAQRETDSSQGKRRIGSGTASAQSLGVGSPFGGRPKSRSGSSSRGSLRTAQSARLLLEGNDEYQATKREIDLNELAYKDPVGPAPERPKTGLRSKDANDDYFDDVDLLDDDFLPGGD